MASSGTAKRRKCCSNRRKWRRLQTKPLLRSRAVRSTLLRLQVMSDPGLKRTLTTSPGVGKAFTWGEGSQGQLGLGDAEDKLVPSHVTTLQKNYISDVGCGGCHTIMITGM